MATQQSYRPLEHPILTVFRERKNHTLRFHQSLFQRYARRYDMYRCVYRGRNALSRNRIFVPYPLAMIQAGVARQAQISFGSYPYVDFEGTDGRIARRNTSLVSKQLKDMEIYKKMVDYFLTGHIYGFTVLKSGWSMKRRISRWRETDPNTGEEFIRSGPQTLFDGPNIEIKDPVDFWPQPGQKEVSDCLYVMDRYFRDITQIEEDVALGRFYASSLALLKKQGNPPSDVEYRYQERFNIYRTQYDYEARANEKFAAPVELVDMFGWVPDEFALPGKDGAPPCRFVLLTVANDAIVMRYREFPYWHEDLGKLFIHFSPMRDPHYMHGIGKIEPIETLAYLANKFTSQKADALDRYLDHAWLVSDSSSIDEDTLWLSPGKIVPVHGDVDESKIRAMVPDMRPLQAAIQEVAELFQQMQIGTGQIDDAGMGISRGDRTTKAEFVGRQELVMNRQMLEARVADEDVVEKLANTVRLLNRQLLKVPREMTLLGLEGEIDPVTGLPSEPEQAPIDLADLNADCKARAVGATQMLGRSLRQNELAIVDSMVKTNPIAVQAMNWVSWLRYTLKTFNFPHVEEFLNKDFLPQINAVGAQSGQGTDAVAQALLGASGPGGAAPPELVNLLAGSTFGGQ